MHHLAAFRGCTASRATALLRMDQEAILAQILRRTVRLTRDPVPIAVQPIRVARVGGQRCLSLCLARERRTVVAIAVPDVPGGIEGAACRGLRGRPSAPQTAVPEAPGRDDPNPLALTSRPRKCRWTSQPLAADGTRDIDMPFRTIAGHTVAARTLASRGCQQPPHNAAVRRARCATGNRSASSGAGGRHGCTNNGQGSGTQKDRPQPGHTYGCCTPRGVWLAATFRYSRRISRRA